MSFAMLAEALFPDVKETREDVLAKYGERKLGEGACVTRYAPSPTGFQHIGGVFAALVSERVAHQSGGVFMLRIEDTDQKREVPGAIEDTVLTLRKFGIEIDEGMLDAESEKGSYGPYRQSRRAHIYNALAKDLVRQGLAYPCFCSEDDLEALRQRQVAEQQNPGYWGEFARCRGLDPEAALARVRAGDRWILRFRSPGSADRKVDFVDLIKGEISFPENNQDLVLIKGDGLPTYHLAHAVDDTLMGTTHVIRGEEWLSSLPIHVQLFDVLGFRRPAYAHIPNVLKQEGSAKRKLSKRKDPESAVTYYDEEGYPPASVVEYLLNIINSSFEDWRKENPGLDAREFRVSLERMSRSGALFDLVKLSDVSKDVIGKMRADEVYDRYVAWAKRFDPESWELVTRNEERVRAIFAIDRDCPNPRKDFAKWRDVRGKISYFFDELFASEESQAWEHATLDLPEARRIVESYAKAYRHDAPKEAWFEQLKAIALELGYTSDRKAFKKTPEAFRGMMADVAGVIRFALTRRANTPDLHAVMQVLGEKRVQERLARFCR